jgi:hypothetical protein
MGICNSGDNGNKRMSNLEKQYPQFYKKPNNVTKFEDDYKENMALFYCCNGLFVLQ